MCKLICLIANRLYICIYTLNTLERGTRKSPSSDLVLVAARAELLIGDRKTDIPFFHRHAVRVETNDDRPRRIG